LFLPSQSSKTLSKNKKVQQFVIQNPDYLAFIREKMQGNHFMNHLGFIASKIEPGYVEGSLKIEEHHKQQIGFLHGGVIATLADLAAGFASFTLVKKGQAVVTAEMKISYLNPGIGSEVFCKGYVIKAGQKLHFAEAELFMENNGKQILIAKGSATYAVIEIPE
jgi:uncharacterized protein (TIGR00369 family)